MQKPILHKSLQQLMQEETLKDQNAVAAIVADSTTLESKTSVDHFSISIINEGSRSTRINPLEEHDYEDNTIINSNNNKNYNVSFSSERKVEEEEGEKKEEIHPIEAWLPITESRKGNLYFCIFHLLSSGLGIQSLALPLAFTTLGWFWGITWFSMAFIWQLYTIWLLTQLHESSTGYRCSRYLQLAMAAFGPKLGKLLALFPVMYLSGGTCVTLLIAGGGTMQHLYHILCQIGDICHPNSPTTIEWYLVFVCLAIAIAQLPNLNSVAWVSLISAITAMVYCTLIWIVSISNDGHTGTTYRHPAKGLELEMRSFKDVLLAIGVVAFSFRGHNLVLEIQGTLPANTKDPTNKRMWKGVKISYALIAICLLPLAISRYSAYGNLISDAGKWNTKFHGKHDSDLKLAIIYFFLIINSLCSFQVYAMLVFDNFELRYVTIKKKPCTWWLRAGLRIFFGALVFFIAVAAPFLPLLAPLIGGIALPVTFAYPCFMWISIKKPCKFGAMWFLNVVLGSLGILLSVLLIFAAISNLVTKGLSTNFFHPKP